MATLSSQLRKIGYDKGNTAALRAFQAAKGLDPRDTAATKKALANVVEVAKRNDRKKTNDIFVTGMKDDAIARVERQLNKLNPGKANDVKVDGVMDEKLADLIVAFKKEHPELDNHGRYMGAPFRAALQKAAGPVEGDHRGKAAYDVARRNLGRWATELQRRGELAPFMTDGIPANINCANFVSACLERAGLLSKSQHTNSISAGPRSGWLSTILANDKDWKRTSLKNARPGDVCVVNGGNHVVMFAGRTKSGEPLYIGANAAPGANGAQKISIVTDAQWGGRGATEVFTYRA